MHVACARSFPLRPPRVPSSSSSPALARDDVYQWLATLSYLFPSSCGIPAVSSLSLFLALSCCGADGLQDRAGGLSHDGIAGYELRFESPRLDVVVVQSRKLYMLPLGRVKEEEEED